MSSEDNHEAAEQASKWEPPSPAARKRLQKCFEHASKQMAQDNFDYATELFGQCVIGDPTNHVYLQNFLGNLKKKYNDNKRGASLAQLKERGARSAAKKALAQEEWYDVIRNGVPVLKVNPWDVPTLTAMAKASEGLTAASGSAGFSECEMVYLKSALEPNPKDAEVNRLCGIALGKRRQFDQAIACWHRVEQARPDDEEPKRAISTLAVEKTIHKFDESDPSKIAARTQAGGQQQSEEELTPEERLRRKIDKDPKNQAACYELAQLLVNADRYEEAEKVLSAALEANSGDADLQEKLNDVQVSHFRHRYMQLEKRAKESGTEEAKAEAKKLHQELNQKLLVVAQHRAERYPNNMTFKFNLAQQHQVMGQYAEAIKEYQLARNDPRKKGECMLALGECFQSIRQYRLAMDHYEAATQEIPDRDADNKKKALYRAGKLALEMKDRSKAEKHLNILASMDFAYRDVSALLDKLASSGADPA
jgi:tetratricopeptide (TPR) repeat protein